MFAAQCKASDFCSDEMEGLEQSYRIPSKIKRNSVAGSKWGDQWLFSASGRGGGDLQPQALVEVIGGEHGSHLL